MEAGAAAATQATTARRTKTKTIKPDQAGTPWWMWLAVAAIVVFCLFPFYWLLNISLKQGVDLTGSSLFPPHPTLNNYQEIFKNPDFTKALRNSAVDPHPNAKGHLLLAEKFERALAGFHMLPPGTH